MSRWGQHVRSRLLAGAFFLLPAVVSVWLVVVLFRWADQAFTAQVLALLGAEHAPSASTVWTSRLVALLVVGVVLYVVGLVATNVVGHRLLAAGESAIHRVPVIGGIYRGFRQLLDSFAPGGSAFRRSVLIEYPRAGTWRIGFVTNDRTVLLGSPPRACWAVFVPMTPNPTSGFLVLVPVDDCRPLGLSAEDGLKTIVSGGLVMPESLFGPGTREGKEHA